MHLYYARSKMGALQRIRCMRVLFGFISSPQGDCTKRTSFLVLPLNSYLDTYMFVSTSFFYRLFTRTVKSVCCWCLCPCVNTTSDASQLQVVILLHGECEAQCFCGLLSGLSQMCPDLSRLLSRLLQCLTT